MPETDRILEAEQSIQSIASELKRMHDAANLLQGAQAQAEAVITSAERLVKETERFSGSCGIIIDKLSSTDLGQKLEGLEKLHAELDAAIKAQNDRISKEILEASASVNSVVNTVDDRVSNLEKEISQLATEFKEFRQEQLSNVRGIKIRQISIIALMVISSMMVLAILLKMWVPALGG